MKQQSLKIVWACGMALHEWAERAVWEMQNQGHEVILLCPQGFGSVKSAAEKGMSAEIYHAPRRFSDWAGQFRVTGELTAILRKLRPDVVYVGMMPASFWMRVAARHAGVPVRINKPASLWDYHTRVYRWIEHATAWMDSFVLASSLSLKVLYEGFPCLRGRVYSSYYGMDMSPYDKPVNSEAIRATLGFAPGDFVVALIAYLIPPVRTVNKQIGLKGHEVLIESIASLRSTHPQLRLLIVGGEHGGPGAYTATLKELAVQREIGDITVFTGHVLNPAPMFEVADVVVVPSLSENVGGPVPAFLKNRPVIASRVGGLPDVVLEGETGFLVPPADAAALAEAIDKMTKLTSSEREKMGRQGNVLCREKFDIQQIVRHEMSLCFQFLKSSHREALP